MRPITGHPFIAPTGWRWRARSCSCGEPPIPPVPPDQDDLWYLPLGIDLVDCDLAYRAKGAASLAASLINRAHPGTNDAVVIALDGGAPPQFPPILDANGWLFGANQNLGTGLIGISDNSSFAIRYSDLSPAPSAGCKCIGGAALTYGGGAHVAYLDMGVYESGGSQIMNTDLGDGSNSPGYVEVPGLIPQGVLIVTKDGWYLDGILLAGWTAPGAFAATPQMGIGLQLNDISYGNCPAVGCHIQGYALYNKTLTPTQVAELSASMLAF